MPPPRRPRSQPAAAAARLGGLTERALAALVPERIHERGAEYYRRGHVVGAAWRGDVLHVAVQGSEEEPYRVVARSRGDRVEASCDCPYADEWDGWCKHIVAALLAAIREGDAVPRQPTVPELVAPLDRDGIVRVLDAMVEQAPDVYDLVAEAVAEAEAERRRRP